MLIRANIVDPPSVAIKDLRLGKFTMVFRQRSIPWHFRRRGNSLASARHHLAGRMPAPLTRSARRVFDGDAATGPIVALA